ncbi:MAG: ribosome biogenesis GTPase YlqF [Halanaerobiaceae bacterium]
MIQWYPGHMAKARREVEENLRKVDVVVEVLDARIPQGSKNPDLDDLVTNQDQIIVLNKIDLADSEITRQWQEYFSKENQVVLINSIKKKGISHLLNILETKRSQKSQYKKLKIMILGITNVGKSTLINAITESKKAKTGKKPGVTRGQQWIKVNKNIYLMDTPGILWPKFENEIGYKLALTGAINRDVFDVELVAYKLVQYILEINPEKLEKQYNINTENRDPYEVFSLIGKSRGCFLSGGKIDKNRAGNMIINDFQNGKFKRISLEKPT